MNSQPKTVKEIQSIFSKALSIQYEQEEIRNFISLSFEHLLNYNRMDLHLKFAELVDETTVAKFESIVSGLLEERPIQYLLGTSEFFGLKFLVNNQVLIPRQETEELVHWVIQDFKLSKVPIAILDIGTGSGCIAISLKKQLIDAQVTAYDISQEALNTAQRNAAENEVEIDFQLRDILAEATAQIELKQFDCIVSNPPYVLRSESKFMAANVLNHEPHLALFVQDNNPLLFYEAIAKFAQHRLKKEACIYFEINESLANQLKALMELYGFNSIEIRKDMNGRDRMMKAKKK